MDVITLSNSNFTGVSARYQEDTSIALNTGNYITYDGINLSIVDSFSGAKDTSNNYYSNFILTDKVDLNLFASLSSVNIEYPYSVTTYLGLYTAGNILPKSLVLSTYVQSVSTNAYTISFVTYDTNTQYQNYKITFINKTLCYITQEINGITWYFTYFEPNSGASSFLMVDSYINDECNLFEYIYDSKQSQLILHKLVGGLEKYVGYDTLDNYLSMYDYVSGSDTYSVNSAFKIKNTDSITLNLPCDWYSYVKIIDVDNLNVNNERSVDNVKLNYLLNITNEKLVNNSLPLNIIPLKNDKDNKNALSRGSIINQNVDGVILRDYTSLNTGTTQLKGSVDFNTTYSTNTTQLLLKSDSLTIFYFPYESFPVVKLNINDSSLVNSGCIAGDSPVNSDKVFKHKTLEYFSLPFNDNNSETTGTYLCSWLKGGNTLSAKPIWVDRYYNPSRVSGIDALSFNNNSNYTTEFTQISTINNVNSEYPVFDVQSNLTFEPGVQYAIQHLGSNNIIELIESLSANVVQKYFTTLYDTLNQPFDNTSNEVVIGDKYYTKFNDSTQASELKEFNNFTINFDLYASDWTKPLGYQILGNYNTYGFGIFNYQHITPFITTRGANTVYCYNTDLQLLDSVTFSTNIINLTKLDPVGNLIVITDDDNVNVVSYNSVIVNQKNIPNIKNYTSFYSTLDYTYCYTNNFAPLKINNSTLDYETIEPTGVITITTNGISLDSVSLYPVNNNLYVVPGYNVKYCNGKIYFLNNYNNTQNLCVYDIVKDTTLIVYQTKTINDYIANEDGTLYVVYDNNKLLLSDNYYRIQTADSFPIQPFSTQPSLSAGVIQSVDFIRNIDNKGIVDEKLVFNIYTSTTNQTTIVTTNKIIDANVVIQNSVVLSNSNGVYVYNLSNFNYTLANLTGSGKFEFRLGLPNVYNDIDNLLIRYILDVSTFEPGYHNFAIRFDSVNGVYSIFIDGREIYQQLFQGGQYSFSDILDTPFMCGNCIYYKNNTLSDYTKKANYYFTTKLFFKNFYLYKVPLSYYNILLHLRQNYPISDVKFQLPTGKRNFVENIQQFFKFKVPGVKSNYFDVDISNLPVSAGLKEILNNTIADIINKNKPSYTELNNINYHE